jgi:hypothetical protein
VLCGFLVFAGLGSGTPAAPERRFTAWHLAPAISPITVAVGGIALVALANLLVLPPLFERLMPLRSSPRSQSPWRW